MSLYDDIEPGAERRVERAPPPGWGSSNIKLLQSQMRLKKAVTTQPRRDVSRRSSAVTLAPVINLKAKQLRDDEEPQQLQPLAVVLPGGGAAFTLPKIGPHMGLQSTPQFISFGPDYQIKNEYDPLRPNDYDRIVRDIRREKDRERERERKERDLRRHSDEEAEREEEKKRSSSSGAAIAPPSFLQENSGSPPRAGATPGGSIAAMIMARYGYKAGQGLGKLGQGISRALEVEKTSKRGGRIIHEKDKLMPLAATAAPSPVRDDGFAMPLPPSDGFAMPPPPGDGFAMPPPPGDGFAMPPPPAPMLPPAGPTATAEPTMADILRNPTKVVLLRNMVGGGEVDDELEGEVKEECTTKYGDVIKVIIYEIPGAADTDAVRIFVEFKRVENAIKALVDLNGRFFGGRQVRARFYRQDKYQSLSLNENIP